MRRCFLAVAVLALAACSAWADDAESSDVLVLTDSSMKAVLADHDAAGILVKFYAPWCGHCKNLAPTYEKVATALKGDVAVAKVCTARGEIGPVGLRSPFCAVAD